MDVAGLADGVDSALRAAGTPERAAAEKAYLKSGLDHYGTTVGDIRRAVRTRCARLSHDDLLAVATKLWRKPVHERRLAAAILLDVYAGLLTEADLPLVERLIREARTWALVDVLAGNVVGQLLAPDPDVVRVLRRWASDDDFWVRRSALLAFIAALRAGPDFARDFAAFSELAELMVEEKEFFVRKAIGWVLREASKKHPDDVFAWVGSRTHRLSGVSVREAVKYLERDQRDAVLLAYQERRTVTGTQP